jgi:hypothetical protein
VSDEFPLLPKTTLVPAEASLYSERLGEDKNGDLWIRSFLINTKRNVRGWRVNHQTIRDRVVSAIKKPITIFRNAFSKKVDHPEWDTKKSADANFKEQAKYAIGTIERVLYDKESDSYYADSKITDPQAKEYIKGFQDKKIPLPVSPQIIYDPKTEQPNYYSNWFFSHLAIVEKGAYGPDAKVLHVCEGDGDTCHNQFQGGDNSTAAASASEFCITQALKDASGSIFDTSHVSQSDISDSSQKMAEPMTEVKPDQEAKLKESNNNKPANPNDGLTLTVPFKLETPYFRDAPSINQQAREQNLQPETNVTKKAEQQAENKEEPKKQGENKEGEEAENTDANKDQRIADLESQLKKLIKQNEENAVAKRLAEVANAIPWYLPDFLGENGNFSQAKYNKMVEEVAAAPYSLEHIHFMFKPRIDAFEEQFRKSTNAIPKTQIENQQGVTNAPKSASASAGNEIYKVPAPQVEQTKAASASSSRNIPTNFGMNVPANGKKPGRLA